MLAKKCREAAWSVLEKMKSYKITVGQGGEMKELAIYLCSLDEVLLWDFVDAAGDGIMSCLPKLSKLTPRIFHTKYLSSTNAFLGSTENRDNLNDILSALLPAEPICSSEARKWFVTQFFMQLSIAAETYFLQYIKGPLEVTCINKDYVEDRDNPEDEDFKQSVYYMGGSCVKSIFRKGRKKSGRWVGVLECVKDRLLAGELLGKPMNEIVAWTESLDRGGLLYINGKVYEFLMALSAILKDLEEPNGTIKFKNVLHSVKKDKVMSDLWKEIVGDSLNGTDTEFLLENLCEFFLNAWGKGVEKRHLNALQDRAKGKVPLRAALAR